MRSTSASSLLCGDEGSEPSHPPLSCPNLCQSFLEVGALLYSSCPDLFSNALSQLSNQLSLALVKNPNVLRSVSSSPSSSEGGESKVAAGEAVSAKKKSGHAKFRKYVLPKDAPPEFYQCMKCGERRAENSFVNDHTHFGKKSEIRWYCPLCQSFFAVTHRSGHIKCKHPCGESSSPSSPESSCIGTAVGLKRCCVSSETSSLSCSPEQEPTASVFKRRRLEEEEEQEFTDPPKKRICLSSEPVHDSYQPPLIDDYVKDIISTTATTTSEILPLPVVKNETEEVYVPVDRVASISSLFEPTLEPADSSCCSSELFSDDLSPEYNSMLAHYV